MQAQAHDLVMQVENVKEVHVNMTAQTRQLVDIRGGIPGVRNIIAIASGKGGVGKKHKRQVYIAISLAETGAKVRLARRRYSWARRFRL